MAYPKDPTKGALMDNPMIEDLVRRCVVDKVQEPIEIRVGDETEATRLREGLYGIFRYVGVKKNYMIKQKGGLLTVVPKKQLEFKLN